MNTKCPSVDNEPLLPELELPADALVGDNPPLGDDSAEDTDRFLQSRFFAQRETSFFSLPMYHQLGHRPYHEVVVQGPFDTRRLAIDYRQFIYRSEVACPRQGKPSVVALLFCLGNGVLALQDGSNLTVIAPTPQAATKALAGFRKYLKPIAKAKPGFLLISL